MKFVKSRDVAMGDAVGQSQLVLEALHDLLIRSDFGL
jgi:hypothetical protein